MKVHILATGSSGNSVAIDDTFLIDAGINIKDFKKHNLDNIKEFAITHAHGDHMKKPLVRHLLKKGLRAHLPADAIALLIEEDMVDVNPLISSGQIVPLESEKEFKVDDITITPLAQKHHDITNHALVLANDNHRLLFATDLDTLEPSEIGLGLLDLGMFDTIMLEGNYDEIYLREYIEYIISLVPGEEPTDNFTNDELDAWVRTHYRSLPSDVAQNAFRATQNRRHLSKQQARAYAKTRLKEGGRYYEIHRSSMFYQKPVDWYFEHED